MNHEVFTGECFGGPLDGDSFSSPAGWFPVDMLSGSPLPAIGRNPRSAIDQPVVQTGWYKWNAQRARWEWNAP